MIHPGAGVFPLIPFILLIICTICAINLYLGFKRNKKDPFGCVINALTIYLFINAFFVWMVECFFANDFWISRMFPFIFLYGPFYYFFLRALRGGDLSKKCIFLHIIPFLVFFICFVIYAYEGWYNDSLKYEIYNKYKVKASFVSLVGYCLYGFYSNVNFVGKLSDRRTIALFSIMLLFLTLFYFAISISRNQVFQNVQSVNLYRVTIYCSMLVAVLLLFGYQTRPLLILASNVELEKPSESPANVKLLPKYEKSFLTESQLDAYEVVLNDILVNQKLFLNQELSLGELASETKMPTHHLTQVLNTRLNISFHNYINQLRVLHACELMNTAEGMRKPLEELGGLSGFNSKVSFNRHFKLQMKCTPSEYRRGLV